MKTRILISIAAFAFTLLITATNGYSSGRYGDEVNTLCSPLTPYSSNDCNLCHSGGYSNQTPAKEAYLAGGTTLTDFFCPAPSPTCTDNDNDGFAMEGGDCGPADCDDSNPAINPEATENCSDSIDNNCNGLVDAQDPAAVGCRVCTDNDKDTFAAEGGDCGPADCDDTDATINPDAVEVCTDGMDNDCNGLVDTQDPNAVDCPQECFDNDGDTYSIDGGDCGPVDCNDNDADINPGVTELCDDKIDNDCDGSVDEGCDVTCPDVDGDGYQDAACGGTDCNDNDDAINPSATEIPGNGIDENCNGSSDDVVEICSDGSLLSIREMKYNKRKDKLYIKGRATVGTTLTVIDSDTAEILADGIRVRGGKWRAEINVGSTGSISVVSSNGCTVTEIIQAGYNSEEDSEVDDD